MVSSSRYPPGAVLTTRRGNLGARSPVAGSQASGHRSTCHLWRQLLDTQAPCCLTRGLRQGPAIGSSAPSAAYRQPQALVTCHGRLLGHLGQQPLVTQPALMEHLVTAFSTGIQQGRTQATGTWP